jgi:hypothetical protein
MSRFASFAPNILSDCTLEFPMLNIARLYRVAVVLALSAATLSAQDKPAEKPDDKKPVYQPQGAPADPKVAMRWNHFHDYTESSALLKKLAETFPNTAKLQSLGKSYGGRDMWVITITDFEHGDAERKPAFWIDAAIHANEIQATEVSLYTAWYLCEMQARSPFVKQLLEERTFYIAPMLSPDSRDEHFYNPNTTHSPRTGQRPVDDDKDGRIDEDKPNDLNGDGHITQMRIRDPNGKYKPHADHPQWMVRVKDGEKGEFRLLGSEGIDNDGDGEVNEDGDGYYDPNRDWPADWQPSYVQYGAFRYPFSILENRLIGDFLMAHPNIAGVVSYHNAGGMLLRGPGLKESSYAPADVQLYDQLGKQGEKILPGYRYLVTATDLYEVYGGSTDWTYQHLGILSFTTELWAPFNFFRQQEHGGYFGSEESHQLFNKYLLLGDGFVDWEEVEHPQYGKIEVGGLKKNWMRQPPSFLLEEECHRNMAFTLYFADQMPQVKVNSIEVKSLGGDVHEVTAVIANTKLLPTHTQVDLQHKITPPDTVTLSSENAKVLTGLVSREPFFKEPEEQRHQPKTLKVKHIPGHDVMYVRWIVSGKGPYKVEVSSTKGGRDEKLSE